ncbi:MAG: hypothetical protein CO108_07495 [Deltaproteobacteria bacterium CG_4_9_14_3_um_filter_63_12]|nr:MAG: hypothetical protein COW42_09590 [Deltaproteobacteria bacterium CG17_big_fil_post_rev_8_21_14_2_50_63_7]PJB45305.1 MAG: hypothetical protein CO108_07495 [Deltaproteobacteria bacterium CG_4_9_14_3_um_filter_63_12]
MSGTNLAQHAIERPRRLIGALDRTRRVFVSYAQEYHSEPTLERVLWPLDRARWLVFRGLGPVARSLLVRREARVAFGGSLLILSSLALTLTAPRWLLARGARSGDMGGLTASGLRPGEVDPGGLWGAGASYDVESGGLGPNLRKFALGSLAVAGGFVVCRCSLGFDESQHETSNQQNHLRNQTPPLPFQPVSGGGGAGGAHP